MALSSRAATVARQVTRGVRQMSMVPQDEAIKTSFLWRNIGLAGVAVVGVFIAREVVAEEHHAHPTPKYSHLKIRNKMLFWGASDCDLFDMECRRNFWKNN